MPPTYPECPFIQRSVRIGGLSKPELLAQLQKEAIELNAAARVLFADDRFTVSPSPQAVATVELTVANLGFAAGTTSLHLYEKAAELSLSLCPLELGPHLRLQYRDQPEGHIGHPQTQHKAPPGSLTIASAPIAPDDETPKGFYLRRIEGVLWLRGYHAGPDHLWSPEDHFLFAVAEGSRLADSRLPQSK